MKKRDFFSFLMGMNATLATLVIAYLIIVTYELIASHFWKYIF